MAEEAQARPFDRELHVKFLRHNLARLPKDYAAMETHRLSLAYFCLSALDVMGDLDRVDRQKAIEWVYAQQLAPETSPGHAVQGGFRGGPFLGVPYDPEGTPYPSSAYDQCHIAMTYTALAILRILGDDLTRVRREPLLRTLRHMQNADGSFPAIPIGGESDMRFIFCAAAICTMLDDWNGMDVESAVQYIRDSQSYDGGIGLAPGLEAHGGPTYCAVAALALMGRLSAIRDLPGLVSWCLARQVSGMQGRTNKPPDSCYTFWIGATLHLLEFDDLLDHDALHQFCLQCQCPEIGGFSKFPDTYPDLLHTYYSLCGFSLMKKEPGFLPLDWALGITKRASGRQVEGHGPPISL